MASPGETGRSTALRAGAASGAWHDVQNVRRREGRWSDRMRGRNGRGGSRQMNATVDIHPTAIVAADAELGNGVQVGAYAIVGEKCANADDCIIAPRAVLERNVNLARGVKIGVGSVLGGDPQDLKFKGEQTTVEIGENTVIREYTTINRGTAQSFKTSVGKNCFLMSYVHLAHDCHIGDGVIISNGTQLAGHVTIDEKAIVSGLVAVHQFATIGRFSFIGGCSRVAKDVPPYVKAVGNPIKLYGLNV